MKKQSITLLAFALLVAQISDDALGGSGRAASKYIKPDTYNYMYPYMNNQMRTDLNPGVTVSQSTNPMDVVVKTKSLSPNSTSERRVVPRRATNQTARAAQIGGTAQTTQRIAPQASSNNRRVVARQAKPGINTPMRATSRGDNAKNVRAGSSIKSTANAITPVSASRCMADYTECMNRYCLRENTDYNRCFCSAKLSQIDAKYKPEIEKLFTQILTAKGTNKWSDDEMNEYWMDTVGKYNQDGTNSWTSLDNALNIDWSSTENTIRGQNAFTTGHQYCAQHLNNCYYMSSNLRDAYRSEIARDCAIYEQSLQKLKTAAESVLEYYND